VLIPSTATSMQSAGVAYTQLHQYTATTGGSVPFRTKVALDLWTTAQPGQSANVLADGSRWRYNGTTWVDSQSDTGWISTGLQNSWVNFGAGYADAAYRKKGSTVMLRGTIKSGTVASTTVLMTLPIGFRPSATIRLGTGFSTSFMVIDVKTNGDVIISSSGVTNSSLMLDPIRFEAD